VTDPLEAFDYDLPAERIAQYAAPRGASRLLVLAAAGARRHRRIADLPELLDPGDLLVVNDSRVLPARLFARRRSGGGRVELLLVERLAPRRWTAIARPGRRLRTGAVLEVAGELELIVEEVDDGGLYRLRGDRPLAPLLERHGHIPLPPYIQRPDEPADRERYQTVFARTPGSIAAPTAGLHFDDRLLAELRRRQIEVCALTLHVGPATFQPIRGDSIDGHRMAGERFAVTPAAAARVAHARARGGRVVAVGTTVVRTLETVAAGNGLIAAASGRTELFIRPGHRFRVVDLLLTNFHLPRSTLLLLVCALGGRERVLAAYREAVAEGYRFYSYGDAMLVDPAPQASGSDPKPGRPAAARPAP
jgi:S-adenosylmethionine:tRNA ribosyltransferase-isomerase